MGRPVKKQTRWLTLAGYGMVLAGVAVLAWVAWQFWGTNWVSERRQVEVAEALEDGWAEGSDTATTDFGRASAILHVPRWGDDYAVPVLAGSSDEALAAGIGHIEDTADPGDRGNYVLAGHRVTHGEPFKRLLELKEGDQVIVETRDKIYTYVLDGSPGNLTVNDTETWVLDPDPQHPGAEATTAVMTLTTCQDLFHSPDRSVGFAHLAKTVDKP
jgi:sortase A